MAGPTSVDAEESGCHFLVVENGALISNPQGRTGIITTKYLLSAMKSQAMIIDQYMNE
jgi:hypothetical protein